MFGSGEKREAKILLGSEFGRLINLFIFKGINRIGKDEKQISIKGFNLCAGLACVA